MKTIGQRCRGFLAPSLRRAQERPRRRLAALLLVPASVAYYRELRAPILTWGATRAEASASLRGDELLRDAAGVATRAIDIDAPAAAVWPWLAQMGPAPRGGAYSYDWIENLLGLHMHSVDRVLPEFQNPLVGESIGFGKSSMRIELVERDKALALRSRKGDWVWIFSLEEHNGGTRLISRNRFLLPSLTARIGMVAMEPCSLVMERKMLRGIKARSERLAACATNPGSSPKTDRGDARMGVGRPGPSVFE